MPNSTSVLPFFPVQVNQTSDAGGPLCRSAGETTSPAGDPVQDFSALLSGTATPEGSGLAGADEKVAALLAWGKDLKGVDAKSFPVGISPRFAREAWLAVTADNGSENLPRYHPMLLSSMRLVSEEPPNVVRLFSDAAWKGEASTENAAPPNREGARAEILPLHLPPDAPQVTASIVAEFIAASAVSCNISVSPSMPVRAPDDLAAESASAGGLPASSETGNTSKDPGAIPAGRLAAPADSGHDRAAPFGVPMRFNAQVQRRLELPSESGAIPAPQSDSPASETPASETISSSPIRASRASVKDAETPLHDAVREPVKRMSDGMAPPVSSAASAQTAHTPAGSSVHSAPTSREVVESTARVGVHSFQHANRRPNSDSRALAGGPSRQPPVLSPARSLAATAHEDIPAAADLTEGGWTPATPRRFGTEAGVSQGISVDSEAGPVSQRPLAFGTIDGDAQPDAQPSAGPSAPQAREISSPVSADAAATAVAKNGVSMLPEKIAVEADDRRAGRPGDRETSGIRTKKDKQTPVNDGIAKLKTSFGTETAVTASSMSHESRHSRLTPHPGETISPAGGIEASTAGLARASESSTRSPAQASAAVQAIRQIADAADVLWATERSGVNLELHLDDVGVAVRVEYRDGEIRATFQTQSTELRDALAKAWEFHASAVADQKPYRFASPVFTATPPSPSSPGSFSSDSFSSSTGGDTSHHSSHSGNPGSSSQGPSGFSGPRLASPAPAASMPEATGSSNNSQRLHAFA